DTDDATILQCPISPEAHMSILTGLPGVSEDNWQSQLDFVVEAMREMSEQTDPQEMSRLYGRRMRAILPVDASLSISRPGLARPASRVTRSSRWQTEVNPWKQKDALPLHRGGLLAELIYANRPRLFDDLQISPDEPAGEYLEGFRSAAVIPMFDR